MANAILGNDYIDPFNFTGWKQNNPYNIDYSSMPQAPQLQNPMSVPLDDSGLKKFQGEAMRTGPSAWADLATAKTYSDQANSSDAAMKNAASNTATSRNNLAMNGGLRSGAAERVQTSGNRDSMNAQQDLAKEGNSNRMQVGINDEQNRITQLGMLPGMQIADSKFKTDQIQAENQNLEQDFQTRGGMWGAAQQGAATAAAAPKPKSGLSWICTEAKKMASSESKWSGSDADALGVLTEYGYKKDPERTRFYFAECHALVKAMHARQNVKWPVILSMVHSVIALTKEGQLDAAWRIFAGCVTYLMLEYTPGLLLKMEAL